MPQATAFLSEDKENEELVNTVIAGQALVLALEKPFAVESLAHLLGPPDGSLPGTLRSKFGDIHASESLSSAAKELAFFFGDALTTRSETFAWIKPDVSRHEVIVLYAFAICLTNGHCGCRLSSLPMQFSPRLRLRDSPLLPLRSTPSHPS